MKFVSFGRVAGALLATSVAGCASDEPTFSSDVAPILEENCVSCHRSGGIAPFSLTDYDSARRHARAIAEVTRKRQMPPMPVNNDGSCNEYSNARWLERDEIETLAAWANAGAPAGDGSRSITPPRETSLEEPDVVLTLGAEYLPDASQNDDYRCFVLPAPLGETAFMKRYEVVPGDARVVHHAIVFQPLTTSAAAEAHARDEAEAGEGYTCFGGPGVDASPVALWAPGTGVVDMPAGTGVALEAGRDLVLQIHYNLEHGAHPDRTSVKLEVVPDGVVPGVFASVENTRMMLPPGQAYVEAAESAELVPNASFVAHGAMPHMHTLGRTLRVEAEAEGRTRCLVDVDRWDFHWQNAWWYTKPLVLAEVSALSIHCGFDTRGRTETVPWGEGTADEMCISYFYLTTESTPEISCTNAANPLFGSCVDALFDACFAPDTSGTCTPDDTGLSWSDGSRFVNQGEGAGFYAPGSGAACIVASEEAGRIVLESDGTRVSYVLTARGAEFTCPDGSTFEASAFHVNEFSVCQGVVCPLD